MSVRPAVLFGLPPWGLDSASSCKLIDEQAGSQLLLFDGSGIGHSPENRNHKVQDLTEQSLSLCVTCICGILVPDQLCPKVGRP